MPPRQSPGVVISVGFARTSTDSRHLHGATALGILYGIWPSAAHQYRARAPAPVLVGSQQQLEAGRLGSRDLSHQPVPFAFYCFRNGLAYMEHMGMGIPRKIIRGMRAHNGTEPELIADSDGAVHAPPVEAAAVTG